MSKPDFSGLDDVYPETVLDKVNPVKQVGKALHRGGLAKSVGMVVCCGMAVWGVAAFLGCANFKNAGNTLTNVSVRESYKRQAKHCDPNPIYSWLVGYDNRLCELTLQEFVDKAIAAGTVKAQSDAIDEATLDQLVQRGVREFDKTARNLDNTTAVLPGDSQIASHFKK